LDSAELSFRQDYWAHVRLCLIQFHQYTEAKALKAVKEFQERFPLESEKPEVTLIYHFEPFRLACKITGKRLSVKDFVAEYSLILDQAVEHKKTSAPTKSRSSKISSTAKRKTSGRQEASS